ncbi:hypothetical protein GCM10022378_01080 [Salinicoccus jeotgali]|uniref:Uncharacterized protein n=1 Tax=Salinicoccus jeotgali TaxID=381634 RepID=A0ABP7E477_9STAP
MSFGMMFLITMAFMFAIFGFAATLYHFLSKALTVKDGLVIDTPEEALERDL